MQNPVGWTQNKQFDGKRYIAKTGNLTTTKNKPIKDKSVKIALDSKKLNLVDALALYITKRKNSPGKFWFSKKDLKYAYSQIPLDDLIEKLCNFSILEGRATGTYKFLNGFYGLTDGMPATFQKTIDKTLEGISSKLSSWMTF